jgi:glutamate racemase
LLESYGRNVKVVTQGCIGLVECIERGELHHQNTYELLKDYCAPLLAEGADTIVLGCTHYPFVKGLIQQIVGPDVALIDTGAAVAKQLQHRLEALNLLIQPQYFNLPKSAVVKFYTNSPAPNATEIIHKLWEQPADVILIDSEVHSSLAQIS